jgi:hypothetical protein
MKLWLLDFDTSGVFKWKNPYSSLLPFYLRQDQEGNSNEMNNQITTFAGEKKLI